MNVWDNKWKDRQKDIYKCTSTQSLFARRAYGGLTGWFDGGEHDILEVGCGTGRFCIRAAIDKPAANVIGIDVSDESLKLASSGAQMRGLKNIRFIKGSTFSIPFPDGHFDVVFSEGMLEHFRN